MLVQPKFGLGEAPTTDIVWWKGPLEVSWAVSTPEHGGPSESITKEIRSFWKPFVPLVCKRVFEGSDGLRETFTYQVIGRWAREPDASYPDFSRIIQGVVRPFDFPFEGGVIYEQVTISAPWPKQSAQQGVLTPDIPLAYPDMPLPEDWQRYECITAPPISMRWDLVRDWIRKSIFFTLHVKGTIDSKLDALEAAEREAMVREGQKIDANADYKFKQRKNVFNRAVAEGRFVPLPRMYEPKPYVFHGRR